MTDKPLLLIDVDGVLCPFGSGEPHYYDGASASVQEGEVLDAMRSTVYPGYTFHEDHHIHYSQDNARRLKQLAQRFELAWCTGWQEEANDVIAPLHGLPKLPVVMATGGYSPIHWKLDWIEEFVGDLGVGTIPGAGRRPYAFIDDDISDWALDYAAFRNRVTPTLWLPIKCSEGLTDDHVQQLEDFADQINTPE